jgi:hypothetical protein
MVPQGQIGFGLRHDEMPCHWVAFKISLAESEAKARR